MKCSDFQFPNVRFRRNRETQSIRNLVKEHSFSPEHLILPVFLTENTKSEPIASLPGVQRWSLGDLPRLLEQVSKLHIPAVAFFPQVPADKKTADCSEAFSSENLVSRALRLILAENPNISTVCDVALDPYNPDGQDGLVSPDGKVLNDETLSILEKQALSLAENGASIIAPSDMMDGRVGRIRTALENAGHKHTAILSYAAKYASAFYGPFRDAIGSSSALRFDKSTYQMDPSNSDEALREVAADIGEGADMVMVKPGMPYLDIIQRVKRQFGVPTFAYHVSGEYAMLKAASQNGWLDYEKCLWETMTCFRRAGSDAVLTYAALDIARLWFDHYGIGR